jgi:hypothetical protein
MGKRKIDPATGEPRLTYREQRLVDEFIKNGGNGARAAASAGYAATRADQSAYQVLHRAEVQRHIRERTADPRVSADEIIGTLASFMRGRIGDFLDDSAEFSFELAKQRGVDHLLKTITTTTREIEATKDKPAQTVRTCRDQLHSPIQAAIALARILGIDGKRAVYNAATRYSSDQHDFQAAMAADFKVGTWLENLIQQQTREHGLSRDAVVESLLQVRPEMARYLQELPDPNNSADELSLIGSTRRLGLILDFIAALATDPQASPDNDPVVESALQTETLGSMLNTGAITEGTFGNAVGRIHSRLSEQQSRDAHRLFLKPMIYRHMRESGLTQAQAIDRIR